MSWNQGNGNGGGGAPQQVGPDLPYENSWTLQGQVFPNQWMQQGFEWRDGNNGPNSGQCRINLKLRRVTGQNSQNGPRVQQSFVTVVAFGQLAQALMNQLQTGAVIRVIGEYRLAKWQSNGQWKQAVQCVLMPLQNGALPFQIVGVQQCVDEAPQYNNNGGGNGGGGWNNGGNRGSWNGNRGNGGGYNQGQNNGGGNGGGNWNQNNSNGGYNNGGQQGGWGGNGGGGNFQNGGGSGNGGFTNNAANGPTPQQQQAPQGGPPAQQAQAPQGQQGNWGPPPQNAGNWGPPAGQQQMNPQGGQQMAAGMAGPSAIPEQDIPF